jgi:4-hydroxybenzoate polyprenyltransferase
MQHYLSALDIAFIIISVLAIVRLITYQRDGATFKRSKSLVAWALLCAFAWLALMFVTGQRNATDFPIVTLPLLMFLTVLIFYTHGNISALFRIITRIN